MSHEIKCQFRIYKQSSNRLLDEVHNSIVGIYPGAVATNLSSATIGNRTAVGKEYLLSFDSDETQNQVYHLLKHQCPASVEALSVLAHWSVEVLEH